MTVFLPLPSVSTLMVACAPLASFARVELPGAAGGFGAAGAIAGAERPAASGPAHGRSASAARARPRGPRRGRCRGRFGARAARVSRRWQGRTVSWNLRTQGRSLRLDAATPPFRIQRRFEPDRRAGPCGSACYYSRKSPIDREKDVLRARFMRFRRAGRSGCSRPTGIRDGRHPLAAETASLMPSARAGGPGLDCPCASSCRRDVAFRARIARLACRRRHRHAQFRQRGHRRGREGRRRDHRPQFRHRSPGQGHDQHHFRAARARRASSIRRCCPRCGCRASPPSRATASSRSSPRPTPSSRAGPSPAGRCAAGGDRLVTQVDHAALRIGGAARQRAAAADHAEQHDRRVPEQQRARHHRLRRQPEAHRPDHRLARSAAGRRARPRAAPQRVGARRRRAAEPAARRDAAGAAGGRRRDAQQRVDDHRRPALEQHPGARRQSGARSRASAS